MGGNDSQVCTHVSVCSPCNRFQSAPPHADPTKIRNSFSNFRNAKIEHKQRPPSLFLPVTGYNCGPDSSVGIETGWTVRGSNPGGGARFSAPVQTGPGAHPASCTKDTGSFPGVKSGRGVTLTPHPLLVPWLRKSRVIPLLWAE